MAGDVISWVVGFAVFWGVIRLLLLARDTHRREKAQQEVREWYWKDPVGNRPAMNEFIRRRYGWNYEGLPPWLMKRDR